MLEKQLKNDLLLFSNIKMFLYIFKLRISHTGCGASFQTPKGSFESPNYPDSPYFPGRDCIYSISIPDKRKQVVVHFKEFSLQPDGSCGDSVKVGKMDFLVYLFWEK